MLNLFFAIFYLFAGTIVAIPASSATPTPIGTDCARVTLYRYYLPTLNDYYDTTSPLFAVKRPGLGITNVTLTIVCSNNANGTVPLYRGYSGTYHMSSTSQDELNNLNYKLDISLIGYVYAKNIYSSQTPVYRFCNNVRMEGVSAGCIIHIFSTSFGEAAGLNFRPELQSPVFYGAPPVAADCNQVTLYRLYNPYTLDFMDSTDPNESFPKSDLNDDGYTGILKSNENINIPVAIICSNPAYGTTPIYRGRTFFNYGYNTKRWRHITTWTIQELWNAKATVDNGGNPIGYGYTTRIAPDSIPIYRLRNPSYIFSYLTSYNWTYGNSRGYQGEGFLFYSLRAPPPSNPSDPDPFVLSRCGGGWTGLLCAMYNRN